MPNELVFGPVVNNRYVEKCRVSLPNGVEIDDYYKFHLTDGVTIMPVTKEGKIILIKEYKVGVGREVWLFPSGTCHQESGNLYRVASDELRQETGYSCTKWSSLGFGWMHVGNSPTTFYYLLAEDCVLVSGQQLEKTENIDTVRLVSPEELVDMIRLGCINEQATISASLRGLAKLGHLPFMNTTNNSVSDSDDGGRPPALRDISMESVLMISCPLISMIEGMADYLKEHADQLVVINAATPRVKGIRPSWEEYANGQLRSTHPLPVPEWLSHSSGWRQYFSQALSLVLALLGIRRRFHTYIGLGFYFTFWGVLLKKLGGCQRVVYYTGDFFPELKIFRIIDNYIVQHVDAIWNNSQAMIDFRKEHHVPVRPGIPNLILRLGIPSQTQCWEKNKYNTYNLAFIGNLQRRQGLDLVLDAFPRILANFPQATLQIVGNGVYKGALQEKVRTLGLEKSVVFHGFVSSPDKLDEIFSQCVAGLALYIPEEKGCTMFADPGKVKQYLSYGLPVIMTDISEVTVELLRRRAGFVIDYEVPQLEEVLTKLFDNRGLLKEYGLNAQQYARDSSWEVLLNRVLGETLANWRTQEQ